MCGCSRRRLCSRGRFVALDELGQHFAAEDLDRLHDVLVLVAAGLEHEDHLIDAGLLVAAEELAGLFGRAGAAPQTGRVARRHLGAQALFLDRSRNRLGVVALVGPALARTPARRW